ncbi:hypothetical protein [Hyunsoonleella flava]|nr:hypothetical protein [Hyunsoonleella flava]
MRTVINISKHIKGITEENLHSNKRILSFPSEQISWKRLHHNMR